MAQGEKRKADLKVVILGDSSVGKTTLIHRYMAGIFTNNATDTAGEEKYASLSSFYCRGASAAILAYDLTRETSLKVLKERHIPLLESAEKNCLCVVVGTKFDLVEDNRQEQQIQADTGILLAKSQNKERLESFKKVPYFETSSKTGKNVEDVFSFILQTCLPLDSKQKETKENHKQNDVIDLEKSHQTACVNKKCC